MCGFILPLGSSLPNLATRLFFMGSITFEPWKRLQKYWAPPKCKFFLWLAIRNRCWAANRLQKRGLDHPEVYLLCDQEPENIQHLLCKCIFARHFWHFILSLLGFHNLSPTSNEISFAEWWREVCKQMHKSKRRGFNNVIIMGTWCLWLHRNKAIFNGVRPSISRIKRVFLDELQCWGLAGAKHLEGLGLGIAILRSRE
jgi:hypothetical protein